MIFDTLAYAQRLKSVGFTDAQAEALAEASREMIVRALSAKPAMPREFVPVFSEARTDLSTAFQGFKAGFRADLREMEVRLTVRMVTGAVAVVTAVAAIAKL
jgi:hypothetical protein